jgi:signal transduction histidine kinase
MLSPACSILPLLESTPRGSEWPHHVVITVVDTGDGIDPKFLPYVFDRFRQADVSTTREHSGLGLGLWIVRRLAELHGGSAQAASAGNGQGSTFTARLPVAGAPVTETRG